MKCIPRKENEMKYSIVVPVYKSGLWLSELVDRVGAVMKGIGEPFELILVNDCSPDDVTWPAIEKLAGEFEWVRGVDLFFNAGQFRATLCGLSEARGDFVITMDDDLQHPPEEIPKLIAAIRENPKLDCAFGKYETKKHSGLRNLGSQMFVPFLNYLYGKPPEIQTTSFRIMRKELSQALVKYRIARPQPSPMIVLLTKKVANVSVRHDSRKQGVSNYTFFKLFCETLQSLINVSVLPLRWVSLVGLFFAIVSFGVGLYYFIEWCLGGIGVAGFASLIIAIAFFGGLTLLSIGVLGEYVGRVIQEVSGPSGFSIRRTIR
jgi:dolichol-phosphate mannosyltransferase/undecaprenyl-phosphate 4-deoxy-4-formamido-L-arabinose transferase